MYKTAERAQNRDAEKPSSAMRARTTASGSAMRASDSAADIGEGGGGADDCARGSSARMQSIALEDGIAIVIPAMKLNLGASKRSNEASHLPVHASTSHGFKMHYCTSGKVLYIVLYRWYSSAF